MSPDKNIEPDKQEKEYSREDYLELGISDSEFQRITEILGRKPNFLELSMFSVMWSEHCAYKHSKPVLKLLPTSGESVLQGPGENAGIVDIGKGYAIAFKMESHNHPSAIEPYQGAATGVGGIVRDIFAMGARPIAGVDPLRFGSLEKPRVKYLFEEVVAGIAGYGNCLGLPTIAGDVYFEGTYEGNPLINVMCIGLLKKDNLTKGVAKGEGNKIILIGSKTGRDGIHGCTFASDELDESSEEKRPSVQVGDPFTEKLLIEACLELTENKLLVALQDLGAAGLTSSSSEMASKGGVGFEIDVSKVLRREEEMLPYEVMISESQERMLAITRPEKVSQVQRTCQKWGLEATVIGRVISGGLLKIKDNNKFVGVIPARALADDAPVYKAESRKPAYLDKVQGYDMDVLSHPEDMNMVLWQLLISPNICSRRWIYRQYDHMVQTNSVILPGSDAAVLWIKDTDKGVAVSSDCNGRYCYLDPYQGAKIAVAEAARNVISAGAKPLAITDCLNFGNPEKPEIFWQFEKAVKGMAEACRVLETPVVSGNVSFYNESFGEAVYPTPTVGIIGLLDDIDNRLTLHFKEANNIVALIGQTFPEIGGSEYLKVIHNLVVGIPPKVDLDLEKRTGEAILALANKKLLKSCHDCTEGGLAVALAECCFDQNIGAEIFLPEQYNHPKMLFSESQSRFIISFPFENLPAVKNECKKRNISLLAIGKTGGTILKINDKIDLPIEELKYQWEEALECLIKY